MTLYPIRYASARMVDNQAFHVKIIVILFIVLSFALDMVY